MSFKETLKKFAEEFAKATEEQKNRQQSKEQIYEQIVNYMTQATESINNTNKILSYINDKQQNLTSKVVTLEKQFTHVQQCIEEILFMFETMTPVMSEDFEVNELLYESNLLDEEKEKELANSFKLEDPDWLKTYGNVNLDKEELN